MTFWQVFFLFSLMSALFVLWPLLLRWKTYRAAMRSDHRADAHDAIQDDLKDELASDHRHGAIDDKELQSLERDLEATIAAEAAEPLPQAATARILGKRSRRSLFAVALVIPACVAGAYHMFGGKADWEIRDAAMSLTASPDASEEARRELMLQVRKRLQKTPDNGHLWFLLGSTASSVGDFDEAVSAYQSLDTLYPETPTILAELAQALFLRAGNVMTPDVRKYTQQALQIDADYPTALGLAGIDAFQAGDYEQAITVWQRAVKRLNPQSQASAALSQGIAQAQIALQATSTSKQKSAQGASSLSVTVSLADNVEGLSGQETVFIYARAWQGSKAPLGLKRLTVKELPTTVVLDKTTAMIPGRDIGTASQLEVLARVSKSGNSVPQPGDWLASQGPVILAKSKQKVNLVISSELK